MFQTLKNAWKIPELKSKLLFTLFIIVLYRIGASIPMPWVDAAKLKGEFATSNGNAFAWLNILSSGALSRGTLFALSVSPYITASIVVQLLTIAFKKLGEWQKDGERGRKKLSALTRGITIGLALVTSIGYAMFLNGYGYLTYTKADGGAYWLQMITLIACYCAGASLIMWLAERINEYGIGNGISIILFANILPRVPDMFGSLFRRCFTATPWNMFAHMVEDGKNWKLPQYSIGVGLVILFAAVLIFFTIMVIWFSNSERRIPVQYAKRVVGRKMYGGQSSNLPIKLDMTGVMPIIFASSIVSILPTIAGFMPNSGFGKFVNNYLGMNSFPYIALYLILVVAFAYFYVMISFNPVEVSNNLQNNGGAIPGIRPGRPTVEYITKILNRITLMGAIFLCLLSGLPMIVNAVWFAVDGVGLADLAFSGSSLLIVVGVALETYRQLEAQMTLRNYKGFLD